MDEGTVIQTKWGHSPGTINENRYQDQERVYGGSVGESKLQNHVLSRMNTYGNRD